jgi:hypothetical protein
LDGSEAFQLESRKRQLKTLQDDLDKPAQEQQQYINDLEEWKRKKGNRASERPRQTDSIIFLEERLKYIDTLFPLELASKLERED